MHVHDGCCLGSLYHMGVVPYDAVILLDGYLCACFPGVFILFVEPAVLKHFAILSESFYLIQPKLNTNLLLKSCRSVTSSGMLL